MKKVFLMITLCCVLLTGCNGKRDIEKESGSLIETSNETKDKEVTSETIAIEELADNREKIVERLNAIQEDGTLLRVNFFENNMYVLAEKQQKMFLYKYDMEDWSELSVETETYNTDCIELVPYSEGLVVKDGFFYEAIENYVYDEELNLKTKCKGVMADFSAKGEDLYYYDIDKNAVCAKDIVSGELEVVRKLVDLENVKSGDVFEIMGLAVSDDERYIFYTGLLWEDDGSVECWGYFDSRDSKNDKVFIENKAMKVSEKGIIITASRGGSVSAMGQSLKLSREYYYFGNGIEKISRQFVDERESDSGVYSPEGNILITSYGDTNVNVYNVSDGNIIKKFENDDRIWLDDSIICEKYDMLLCLEPIHESEEKFSFTGKYEILWTSY